MANCRGTKVNRKQISNFGDTLVSTYTIVMNVNFVKFCEFASLQFLNRCCIAYYNTLVNDAICAFKWEEKIIFGV